MKHGLSLFPGGRAGIGLFLLRIDVTIPFIAIALGGGASMACCTLAAILIAALSLGIFTRAAALVALGAGAVFHARAGTGAWLASDMLCALAVALLGPGAISIDAIRFGRRVISLGGRS